GRGPVPGSALPGRSLVCELFSTVVQASLQGPGGGQGQEAGSPARDPLRTLAGASRGRDHRQRDAPGRAGCARSVAALASDPPNPIRSGCAVLGRAGSWSGTGESGRVSRQTPRVVACGRSSSDPPGRALLPVQLADAEGSVRDGLVGDPSVAPR